MGTPKFKALTYLIAPTVLIVLIVGSAVQLARKRYERRKVDTQHVYGVLP